MNNLKLLTSAVLAVMLLAGGAVAVDSVGSGASKASESFVRNAAIASIFEIEAGKLAIHRSDDRNIHNFANDIITSHREIKEELGKVVVNSTVGENSIPDEVDEKHAEILKKLKTSTRENFEVEFITAQKNAYNDIVALFESYSKNGDDEALKEFAAKTLPELKEHERHLDRLKEEE